MFNTEDLIRYKLLAPSLQKRFKDIWDAINKETEERKAADIIETNARKAEDIRIWAAIKDLETLLSTAQDTVTKIESGPKSNIETVFTNINGKPAHAIILSDSTGTRYLDLNFCSEPLYSSSDQELEHYITFPLTFSDLPVVTFHREVIRYMDEGVSGRGSNPFCDPMGWIDSILEIRKLENSYISVVFDSLHESGWGHRERLGIHAFGKY